MEQVYSLSKGGDAQEKEGKRQKPNRGHQKGRNLYSTPYTPVFFGKTARGGTWEMSLCGGQDEGGQRKLKCRLGDRGEILRRGVFG